VPSRDVRGDSLRVIYGKSTTLRADSSDCEHRSPRGNQLLRPRRRFPRTFLADPKLLPRSVPFHLYRGERGNEEHTEASILAHVSNGAAMYLMNHGLSAGSRSGRWFSFEGSRYSDFCSGKSCQDFLILRGAEQSADH